MLHINLKRSGDGKDEKTIKHTKIEPSSAYQKITAKEAAAASPEYKQLTAHYFKSNPNAELLEPADGEYAKIALSINSNQYEKLSFDDKDFIRNLYKAVRLGDLNLSRLATVSLMYNQVMEFKKDAKGDHSAKVCKIIPADENGACGTVWSPKSVSYVTLEMQEKLKNRIKELKAADRNYFAYNFSKKREEMLVLDLVHDDNGGSFAEANLESIKKILIEYITHRFDWSKPLTTAHYHCMMNNIPCPSSLEPDAPATFKAAALKAIEQLNLSNTLPRKFLRILLLATSDNIKELSYDYGRTMDKKLITPGRDKNRESSFLLLNLVEAHHEQFPFLSVSPDYNPNDKNTPLLCMLFPSSELAWELRSSIFGEDATKAFYTMGTVTTRLITACADVNSRPVELTHPDVKHHELAHTFYVYDSLLQSHDEHFHLVRNSINAFKDWITQLRTALIANAHHDMSKIIWQFSDLNAEADFSVYRTLKKNPNANNAQLKQFKENFVVKMLEFINPEFFKNSVHDKSLLLIYDMILNKKIWEKALGEWSLADYLFKMNKAYIAELYPEIPGADFISVYKAMEIQMQKFPKENIEFHILAFRATLHNVDNREKTLALIAILNKKNILLEMIKWERNSGIMLDALFTAEGKSTPVDLTGKVLYDTLVASITIAAKNGVKKAQELLVNPEFQKLTGMKVAGSEGIMTAISSIFFKAAPKPVSSMPALAVQPAQQKFPRTAAQA
jgi:hypothetical protein